MESPLALGSFGSPPRRLRILCIDDHEQMVLLARLVFERAGHYVEHLTDSREAWLRIAADPGFFDAIVTDHQMPHLTGLELVRKLREIGYGGRIIVQSSSLTAKEHRGFENLNVHAILQKPVSVRQLLEQLDHLD